MEDLLASYATDADDDMYGNEGAPQTTVAENKDAG